MLSRRLLTCGATLACAAMSLAIPAASQDVELSTLPVTANAAPRASSRVFSERASLQPQIHPVAESNATASPAGDHTTGTSHSKGTTLGGLASIAAVIIIAVPACIAYAIFYRRARRGVRDMPNYTGSNGPRYGVTGQPQGTGPQSQSWYTSFSPPWSYKHPDGGAHMPAETAAPGQPDANAYGAAPAQGQFYAMPTEHSPAYGVQPGATQSFGYGTQAGQVPAYGTDPTAQPAPGAPAPEWGAGPANGPTRPGN